MLAKLLFVLFLFHEVQCFKYFNTYIKNHDIENAEEIFKEFLEATEMSFTGDKYYERLTVFTENLKIINDMNAKNGLAQFGVTKWSHLTMEEFQEEIRCLPKVEEIPDKADETYIHCDDDNDAHDLDLPNSKDWSDSLPPVKDQQACWTCWIFSAVGAIEAQYAVVNNEVVSLSEQQVQDCTTGVCERGGWPNNVFEYVKNFGGLMAEKDYPYISADQNCSANANKVVARVSSFTRMEVWSEWKMKRYIAKTGPLSVAIDAGMLQNYIGGIINPGLYECITDADHAVLITGYSDENRRHWIIRNSWGSNWGENGYFRIVRGRRACLIGRYVTTVTVEKN